jgi:AcrR family transcriptional regulator
MVRTEILDAAERCLAEAGLHGAPMEAVAARAGVAVGTLYNHFKSRDALVNAVLDRRYADLEACLERQLVAERPFPESFAALVRAAFAHFREHAGFFSLVMQQERVQRRRPGHGPGMLIVLAHARLVFECAPTRAAKGFEVASLHAELAVGCLRAGLLWLLAAERDAAAWASVEREVVAFVLAGVGHHAR